MHHFKGWAVDSRRSSHGIRSFSTSLCSRVQPRTSCRRREIRRSSQLQTADPLPEVAQRLTSKANYASAQEREETQVFQSNLSYLERHLCGCLHLDGRVALASAGLLAFQLFHAASADATPLESLANMHASAFLPGLIGDSPLREGFVSSFLLIFFSEIGDKTFFIALLLALQQPRSLVFTGTFGALAVMTLISVGLGEFLHQIDENLPNFGLPIDDLLAVALLVFFGIQTLRSAATAKETAEEEKEEAKEVVAGMSGRDAAISMVGSTFALVFAAEWGDKSFLATIALAAASDPAGVVLGAVAGHGVATSIAVLGGSFMGRYISERVAQYVGGSLFLVFAAATLFDIVAGSR